MENIKFNPSVIKYLANCVNVSRHNLLYFYESQSVISQSGDSRRPTVCNVTYWKCYVEIRNSLQ